MKLLSFGGARSFGLCSGVAVRSNGKGHLNLSSSWIHFDGPWRSRVVQAYSRSISPSTCGPCAYSRILCPEKKIVKGNRWECSSRAFQLKRLIKAAKSDESGAGILTEDSVETSISEAEVQRKKKEVEGPSIVPDLLDYLNEAWTPFHATAEAKRQLLAAGFHQLSEDKEWKVESGERYFFTRNLSSIVAFGIGQKYEAGNGFNIVAAHTDSPCPKLKPVSSGTKSGFLMVGVQPYGGGLWHTWFDRDLSVAGRVLLRTPGGGKLEHRLVKVVRPILRIPTLAIHLDRTVSTDGFKPNLESHLAPLLATQLKAELNSTTSGAAASQNSNGAASTSASSAHHPLLLEVLAEELSCQVADILDFELNVCDTQPSCLGGARNEFVLSGRLDNLASSFCALRALLDTTPNAASLAEESGVRMVALFDNEEVGSDSAQGAGSPVLFHAIQRVSACLAKLAPGEGTVERSLRRSFLVSADMAHALHPNYSERHEEHHQPRLQQGLVVKHNANQRYATNLVSSYLFKEIARLHSIPTQNFVVRNDMGCGSTIGPILAAGMGIRTVDCGMPQLSMHSVREMCGAHDVDIAYAHFKAFFLHFAKVDQTLVVDG